MYADHYQSEAAKTAVYPPEAAVLYPLLGLIGEVGELAEKVWTGMFPHGIPHDHVRLTTAQRVIGDFVTLANVAEGLKKQLRDDPEFKLNAPERMDMDAGRARIFFPSDRQTGIVKEGGDVAWYLSALTRDLGFRLSAVMRANLDKLAARQQQGKLHGSGDDRERAESQALDLYDATTPAADGEEALHAKFILGKDPAHVAELVRRIADPASVEGEDVGDDSKGEDQ